MAPIKFEENLKDKLEQRTITPSANSWDALATRLDAKPVKNNGKKIWLFAIAASIIGLLLIGSGFLNLDNNSSTTIVNEDDSKNEIKTNVENEGVNTKKETQLFQEKTEDVIVKTETEIPVEIKKPSEKPAEKSNKYIANTVVEVIVKQPEENINQKVKVFQNNIENIKNEDYASNIAPNTIKNEVITPSEIIIKNDVAAVQSINVTKATDNEIDLLLNQASESIAESKPNSIPLDYNELLQDVEDDLEETFREKLLKTVKGGYRSVKTYVAERNE